MAKKEAKAYVDEEKLNYWKEQAIDKGRSLSNLIIYAMKRYTSMNPLPREKKAKK